jgi:hypothetical protein
MGLFGLGGVKPQKVIDKGQRGRGRIVGIEVEMVSGGDGESDRRVDEYAIEVQASPPFVAGVRQYLQPDGTARLGMEVVVLHLDGHAVIDWPATCGGSNSPVSALLKEPPARGITDKTLGLKKATKGVPAQVTISNLQIRDAMMGLSSVLDIDIVVRPDGFDEYDSQLKKVTVPFYATHLAEIGRVLPGWVNPSRLDKVVVDWSAAAEADPGVGVPPAEILAGIGNVFSGTGPPSSSMSAAPDTRPLEASSDGHDAIDGVTFDMWVAVEAGTQRDRVKPADYDTYAEQFGVPPGSYTAAAAGWQARTRTDWRLGAAFAEAVEKARKGRP